MKNILRIPENIGEEIKKDIKYYAPRETIMFLLAKRIKCSFATLYLAKTLLTLDETESFRSSVRAAPSEKFLKFLYSWIKKDNLFSKDYRVVVIHSHPFSSHDVRMSGIDFATMRSDAEIYNKVFPNTEFLFIVFNAEINKFDGYTVYPRKILPLEEITFIGKNFKKLMKEESSMKNKEIYSRMLLIPNLNLQDFQNLRIGIVGMGGVGSSLFQLCLMLGIGEKQETVIVDHDRIEISNISRIPFSSLHDKGKFKVDVAKKYAKRIRQGRKIIAFRKPCYEVEVQRHLASCDVLFGATDSELARYFLNHLATNFLVPVIDTGAGIIIQKIQDEEEVMSGGQIRTYIPDITPCLFCNMGVSLEEVNRELAKIFCDEQETRVIERSGYLRNLTGKDLPQPSTFNLTQHISTLAIDILISYITNGYRNETLHFDLENLEIKKLKAKSQNLCPHCNTKQFLCQASFFSLQELRSEKESFPALHVASDFSKEEKNEVENDESCSREKQGNVEGN